jgi:hypothetical protein
MAMPLFTLGGGGKLVGGAGAWCDVMPLSEQSMPLFTLGGGGKLAGGAGACSVPDLSRTSELLICTV